VAAKLAALNLADWAVRQRNLPLVAALAPASPHAAAQAADANYAAREPKAAESLARRALKGVALSAQALRVYGLSREAQGDLDDAAAAMATAGALGWRDTPTQLWLLDAYARQGDMAAALERADALARRWQHKDQMRLVFLQAAMEPATRAIVAERIAARPNWRPFFFDAGRLVQPRAISEYITFLDYFARTHKEIARYEIEPFLENLVEKSYYAEAREIWQRHAVAGQENAGNAVFDGGFSKAALDGATERAFLFEWEFQQTPGTETRIAAPQQRSRERALYVASGGNIRTQMAAQTLALRPGPYVLAVEAAADAQSAFLGSSWRVECLPGGGALELTGSSATTDGSKRLTYRFEVPARDCAGQRLSLWFHGDYGRAIELWVDNIEVRPAI